MMKIIRHALALTACFTILAGCGGGGSKPAPIPAVSSPTPFSGALGTAQLTLRMPANFHHAAFPVTTKKITYKGKTRYVTVASSRRTPKYINPGTGNLIHVYGRPNSQSSTVEYTSSAGIALPSNANADGSQTINVALPAQQYGYLEIEEKDPTNTNELAAGFVYNTAIAAGQPTTLQITMDMNAQYIALTTDPANGADASVLNSSSFCVYTNQTKFYAFAADSTGGFVLPGSPAGGAFDNNAQSPAIPTPSLNGQYPYLLSTPLGMLTAFPGSNSSINATFTENNPDLGGTTSAYATIGNNGAAPCQLNGSLSLEPANTGDTSVLTVSGGNAPYTVTDPDTNCSVSQTNPPSTLQWNISSVLSGVSCGLAITDANAGNSGSATLDINPAGPPPLSLSPTSNCPSGPGQTTTITVSGNTGPFSVGTPSDPTAYTIQNITASGFDVYSGTNYFNMSTTVVTDTGNSATVNFVNSQSC